MTPERRSAKILAVDGTMWNEGWMCIFCRVFCWCLGESCAFRRISVGLSWVKVVDEDEQRWSIFISRIQVSMSHRSLVRCLGLPSRRL